MSRAIQWGRDANGSPAKRGIQHCYLAGALVILHWLFMGRAVKSTHRPERDWMERSAEGCPVPQPCAPLFHPLEALSTRFSRWKNLGGETQKRSA